MSSTGIPISSHLGELLPYCYARLSVGLTLGSWLVDTGRASGEMFEPRMQRPFSSYIKHNVYITSSGVFEQPVFDCAVAMLGLDNLMFSVDSPLRDDFEAMEFLAACNLKPTEKERFAHGLAEELLGLPPAATQRSRSAGRWKSWSAGIRSRVGRALVAALIK